MKPVRFHPAAREELRYAVEFYESRAEGLGSDLQEEVEAAVRRIAELPFAGSPREISVRRKVLRRFPFTLVYQVREQSVVIVAVMHQRQRPGYWRERTDV